MTSTSDRYIEFALECLESAGRTEDQAKRGIMITMAQAWTLLGRQAGQNSSADTVREVAPANTNPAENLLVS
jgi:hypothetical protein